MLSHTFAIFLIMFIVVGCKEDVESTRVKLSTGTSTDLDKDDYLDQPNGAVSNDMAVSRNDDSEINVATGSFTPPAGVLSIYGVRARTYAAGQEPSSWSEVQKTKELVIGRYLEDAPCSYRVKINAEGSNVDSYMDRGCKQSGASSCYGETVCKSEQSLGSMDVSSTYLAAQGVRKDCRSIMKTDDDQYRLTRIITETYRHSRSMAYDHEVFVRTKTCTLSANSSQNLEDVEDPCELSEGLPPASITVSEHTLLEQERQNASRIYRKHTYNRWPLETVNHEMVTPSEQQPGCTIANNKLSVSLVKNYCDSHHVVRNAIFTLNNLPLSAEAYPKDVGSSDLGMRLGTSAFLMPAAGSCLMDLSVDTRERMLEGRINCDRAFTLQNEDISLKEASTFRCHAPIGFDGIEALSELELIGARTPGQATTPDPQQNSGNGNQNGDAAGEGSGNGNQNNGSNDNESQGGGSGNGGQDNGSGSGSQGGGSNNGTQNNGSGNNTPSDRQLAFVSSFKANGGVTRPGADSLCTQRANAAGLQGQYRALMSVDDDDARNHVVVTKPVYNTQGELVAQNANALWSSSPLANPIRYDEFGRMVDAADDYVMTGSKENGTHYYGRACFHFSRSGSVLRPQLGRAHAVNGSFLSSTRGQCKNTYRIYCVQQP